MELSVFREDKEQQRYPAQNLNKLKLRQKTFPNDIGIAIEKVFKQGVGMAVCYKGRDDGIKNIAPRYSTFFKASVCVTLFECPCHGIKYKVKHT